VHHPGELDPDADPSQAAEHEPREDFVATSTRGKQGGEQDGGAIVNRLRRGRAHVQLASGWANGTPNAVVSMRTSCETREMLEKTVRKNFKNFAKRPETSGNKPGTERYSVRFRGRR
jgi:hypothetical protein